MNLFKKIPLSWLVEDPRIFQVAADNIAHWLDYWFERQNLTPGLSVCIRQGDQTLLNKAWGVADAETGEALSLSHMFRMASQAKMLTADSIFLLQQDGRLNIHDTLGQHLPWLKQDSHIAAMTIADLLAHKSGIQRDGADASFWSYDVPFPDNKKLQNDTNNLPPIDQSQRAPLKYSNWGYTLLGQVIEAASGMPYADFIQARILKPLGLSHTQADVTAEEVRGAPLAKGLGPWIRGRHAVINPAVPAEAFAPAMGLTSTPEDMCKYLHAQFNDDTSVLGKKSRLELSRHFDRDTPGAGLEFGFGRMRYREFAPMTFIGHSGSFVGQDSFTYYEPQLQLAISVAGNCNQFSKALLVESCLTAFLVHLQNQQSFLKGSPLNGRYQDQRECYDIFETKDGVMTLEPGRDDCWQKAGVLKKISRRAFAVDPASDPSRSGEPVVFTTQKGKTTLKFGGDRYQKIS